MRGKWLVVPASSPSAAQTAAIEAAEVTRLLREDKLSAAHEAVWEIPAASGSTLRRLSTEEHETLVSLARQAASVPAPLPNISDIEVLPEPMGNGYQARILGTVSWERGKTEAEAVGYLVLRLQREARS